MKVGSEKKDKVFLNKNLTILTDCCILRLVPLLKEELVKVFIDIDKKENEN